MATSAENENLQGRAAEAAENGAPKIWDGPTRIMHWLNAVAVVLLAFCGFMIMYSDFFDGGRATDVKLRTLHAVIGYVVVASLLLRLVWGFVGSPSARWSAVLPGKAVRRQFWSDLVGVATRRPDASLARLLFSRMVTTTIFIVFILIAVSGLFRATSDLYFPPFGGLMADYVAAPGVDPSSLKPLDPEGADPARWKAVMQFKTAIAGRIHRWGAYAMLALAALHIAGVIMTDARSRGGVIGPIFTGVRSGAKRRPG